jgi:glycosyltransferase involved in cell wall biosynthesis
LADGRSSSASTRDGRARVRVAHVCTIDLSLRYLLGNQMRHLQNAGYDVIGISTPGPHVAWLEDRGVRHVPVTMKRAFTPASDLRAVMELARVMQRERLTIVHTHNAKPGLLGQLAARMAGVPIVVNTIHGYYFQDDTPLLPRRFYLMMEQIAASCSDAILCQSREDLDIAVREHICARDDIEHLGNGIDITAFDPAKHNRADARAALGLAADDLVVGFVGRLVAEKGIKELWGAIADVRKRHPRVKLLVIGETDEHKADALRREDARAYGVDDVCVFTGWRNDLPHLYAAMDVFALPSYREGFPRTPMEASAMGVPVIATDIRGCREAVNDGVNGVLVPMKSTTELARALDRLLSDAALRTRFSEGGVRLSRERFDERRIFAHVERTYARLLEARHMDVPEAVA